MAGRLERPAAPAVFVLAGAVALSAALRLAWAYGQVENRLSFGWDAARRALLNLEAAGAIRHGDMAGLLRHLAGPETWPTLRMAFAAPILAVTGPSLAAESGLTIGHYALLFVALAAAVLQLVPHRRGAALLVFAVAALALAGNRALLAYAATGMLEPLSALTTLTATVAWLALRRSPDAPVWPLGLAANLVFHCKWQHGIILAGAVLAIELATAPGPVRREVLAGLAEVARHARRRATFWMASAAVLVSGAAGLAIAWTSGIEGVVAGQRIVARSPDGALFWAAFFAFYGLLVELWRSRSTLRRAIPNQLRRLFVWLVVPMGAWILVPFTWRLRILLFTAGGFDSGVRIAAGPIGGLAFYLRAFWAEGWGLAGRLGLAMGLALALWALVRKPEARRRMLPVLPILAFAAIQLLILVLATRSNYQPRFLLNLVPLLALSAAAGLLALPRWPRAAAATVLLGLFGYDAWHVWSKSELPSALSRGFPGREVSEACIPLARELPFHGGELLNATGAPWLQDCNLAFGMEAFRRGVPLDVYATRPGPRSAEVVYLSEGCGSPPAGLAHWTQAGASNERGPLCARVFRRPVQLGSDANFP